MIAGIKPSLEIGAKNKDAAGKDILGLRAFDISLDIGFGSDIFFPLFKLSFIATFLCKPIINGFVSALAIIISFGQLKYLLGISLSQTSLIQNILIFD